nr:hypothetical protein [Tanacetum cinerariifolium]
MGNVKKFVAERICHQRQYDRRLNKRQMQMQESKIDMGKAVDADLVVTESSGIELEVDDSEPTHGSNVDIPNIHKCKQTLDLSAGTSLTGQQKQRINFSA